MVLRHQACIAPLVLLAVGLRPSTGRVPPRFGSSSGRLWQGAERAGGASVSQPTALRLGEGGQSCLAPAGEVTRRGPWRLSVARGLRGGAITGADSSEEEGDDSLDDDDFEDEDMTEEEDFGEANFVDRLKQDWKKTPIITKTFFQVSIGIAVAAQFLNNNQWPEFLLLDWQPAIFGLQLWRLFTPFLYLGPVGINFALTVHFAWTYMSQLEKLHYREPHTFVMLLAFGMSSLLVLTLVTGADVNSSFTLGHSLSCFLVMVWSRKFAGTRVNVLDMFELSTELLPYFFVAQTLMMEGVIPWVDLSGLLIGYAWETLSVKGLLKAPKPLVNLFRKNAFLRAEYAKAGKEYGQDLPLHDDDDDEEDTAPVPMPTPDEKSETAGGGGEEEEEGRPEGARGKPAAVEPESKRGDRRREGGSVAPGAAREAAKGEGDEDNVKPAAEPEPSSEADDTEEDAYSSEEESDSGGGNDEAEGNEAGEEQSNEEEELSEESDELEDFEGEAESMLGESEDDLDVEELTDSFEESEEDEESASSSDF